MGGNCWTVSFRRTHGAGRAPFITRRALTLGPRLAALGDAVVLAVNQEYVELDGTALTLNAGDEVALIPPLSGG